ncbi:hypothetical protein GCM10027258_12080 [Amycolatopsis stemonae]
MERPSQEPSERPHPAEAGESPLSFPVEAPRVTGVEPGTGAPFPPEPSQAADPPSFPAEASPVPADAAPSASPLAFPADATPSAGPLAFPTDATPSASSLAFPADATPAAPSSDPLAVPPEPSAGLPVFPTGARPEPLPFPVAEIPGAPPQPQASEDPAEPHQAQIPVVEARPSGFLRLLPAVLTAVAALMTLGGTFLPLFRLEQHVSVRDRFLEAQLTVTETAWGSRIEIPGQETTDQAASPVGIPLILAVLVLAVAALMAFSRPESGRARWLVAGGALFTTGVVLTVGMSGLGWSAMADGNDLEVVTDSGMWLLIGALVLVVAAAVLACLPTWRRRGEDWADPNLAYADTPTPPSGVAITVLPPEDDR